MLDEAAFAGATDTCHNAKAAQRELSRDILQRVTTAVFDHDGTGWLPTVLLRRLIIRGHRRQGRALGSHVAAVSASTGSEFNDVVRGPDELSLMFDGDDCVSRIPQPQHDFQKSLAVARMLPSRRFVEDEQCVDEA